MARSDVAVVDGLLVLGDTATPVDSLAWFTWLESPGVSSFLAVVDGLSFGVRKERKQRGGLYWIAHKRVGGHLRKHYLGVSGQLTMARLREAAQHLGASGMPAPPTPPLAPPPAPPDVLPPRDLLQSKLTPPSPRRRSVARPHLLGMLDLALERPLTVVQAPAGFGKSTLLASWASALARDGAARVAWVSLDAGDDEPLQFWSYLCAALDGLRPGGLAPLRELLRASGATAVRQLTTRMLNALADLERPGVLILDDLHLVSRQAIHDDLVFLIEHLPPRLHLVIASRAEPPLPLARLHARGAVDTLRASDLRFSRAEAAAFLQQTMALELSADAVAALEAGTEGWVAGLQLAALALRGQAGAGDTQAITALMSRNRYLLDYLVGEVLARQPTHLQTFLLQTSVLSRLCGPLCDALILGTAGDAETPAYSELVLEQIERADLFLLPLDGERRWYRYHHLFAEVLRLRLQESARPETVAELHRRASRWYTRGAFGEDAIVSAIAAQDWALTAETLERFAYGFIKQGRVAAVLGWIASLPAEVRRRHPALIVEQALCMSLSNQMDALLGYLAEAEAALQQQEQTAATRNLWGKIANLHRHVAWELGDTARAISLDQRALGLLAPDEREWRLSAKLMCARAFYLDGDVGQAAEQALQLLLAEVRSLGHRPLTIGCLVSLALLRQLQGRLRAAAATFEAVQLPDGAVLVESAHLQGTRYRILVGELLRERGQLDEARQHLGATVATMGEGQLVEAVYVRLAFVSLARLQLAQGEPVAAEQTLGDFLAICAQRGFHPSFAAGGQAELARCRLAQGDLAFASAWAARCGLDAESPLDFPTEAVRLSLARVWIAEARLGGAQQLGSALRLLDRLHDDATSRGRIHSLIEILLVRATAHAVAGSHPAAMADLERALAHGGPEGYQRCFVDEGESVAALLGQWVRGRAHAGTALTYARRLLAAFVGPYEADATAPAGPGLAEPLTAREREVLRLLAEGASNRQIAAALVLSEGTVKKHLANIFGKLDAQSRTQAVARGRAAGLLAETAP